MYKMIILFFLIQEKIFCAKCCSNIEYKVERVKVLLNNINLEGRLYGREMSKHMIESLIFFAQQQMIYFRHIDIVPLFLYMTRWFQISLDEKRYEDTFHWILTRLVLNDGQDINLVKIRRCAKYWYLQNVYK